MKRTLLCCLSAFAFTACTEDPKPVSNKPQTETQAPKPIEKNTTPISIAAAGDIMLGSTFPNQTRMPPNDGANLLDAVAPIFQAADLAFANLEGPMADGGISEKCGESKNCFAFRMPTRYGKHLKAAGLDVMSVANNHANDFGEAGRLSTRKTLDELGIKHAGGDREAFATTFLEAQGKKIAVIGFAHNNVSPNVNDLTFARQLVLAADEKADLVVVSFHGGAEGAGNTRVPKRTELFFGEERGNLPLFARTVIDAGADLVLGHGPHVLRGMEMYKDRLIAYSLGNFATYGWFQLAGATAETMVLDVKLDPDGKLVSGKIHPFVLAGRGVLKKDASNSAISTVRRLSKLDFPQTMPAIVLDGTVLPK